MSTRKRKERVQGPPVACLSPLASAGAPRVRPGPVTDPATLARGRAFSEAQHQCTPMATPGSAEAESIAKVLQQGNAGKHPIRPETAMKQATSGMDLESLAAGAHPQGKAAEVIAAQVYKDAPGNPAVASEIVNPPQHMATNVHDVRVSPDGSSCKDIIFGFDPGDGRPPIWKFNGQVKTGSGRYIAESVICKLEDPRYSKIVYLDARFVNADGTPRVGPDAFSEADARRLMEKGVRLRGIKDLEKRARELVDDVKAHKQDGLDPVAREQLEKLRESIQKAYRPGASATRALNAGAMAAVAAGVISLVVQMVTEGEVDAEQTADAAVKGAGMAIAGSVADTLLYHVGTGVLDMAPEVAQQFAQHSVAAGFFVLATAADIASEVEAVRDGEITIAEGVASAGLKTALNVLPLLTASLGLPGVGIALVAQVGGRWVLARLHAKGAEIKAIIVEAEESADRCQHMLVQMHESAAEANAFFDQGDAAFARVMGTQALAAVKQRGLLSF